jgi:cyclopropane fatty-acyl-phospholipid synthase-like methyltransferase
MIPDPKIVVAEGYDLVAEAYLDRFGESAVRKFWLDELIARLPAGARVLDLGCGAGLPVARDLRRHGFDVTGIDGSTRQIELARRNVPGAEFIRVDMTCAEFATASFNAVTAFYSITHVPRDQHLRLFRRIANWLQPGGIFLASLGAEAAADWTGEWLGAPMYFSHHDASTNLRFIREVGLVVERSEIVAQDNEDAKFLWVIARKTASAT